MKEKMVGLVVGLLMVSNVSADTSPLNLSKLHGVLWYQRTPEFKANAEQTYQAATYQLQSAINNRYPATAVKEFPAPGGVYKGKSSCSRYR